jgi:hypothetical protein
MISITIVAPVLLARCMVGKNHYGRIRVPDNDDSDD